MAQGTKDKTNKSPVLGFLILGIIVGIIAVLAIFNFQNPLVGIDLSKLREGSGEDKTSPAESFFKLTSTSLKDEDEEVTEEEVLSATDEDLGDDSAIYDDGEFVVGLVEEEVGADETQDQTLQGSGTAQEETTPTQQEYTPPTYYQEPAQDEYVRKETVRIKFSGPSLIENGSRPIYRYRLNLNSAGAEEFSMGIRYEIEKSKCDNADASGFSGLIKNPKSGDNIIDIKVDVDDLTTKYDTKFVDYVFETTEGFLVIDGDIGIPVCK